MYDIKQVKDMIVNGGMALSHNLEQRIMNDEMTERDHEFVARAFGTMRDLKSGKIVPTPVAKVFEFKGIDPTE